MKSIDVSDETHVKLRVMSKSYDESISDSIDRLVREWLEDESTSHPSDVSTTSTPFDTASSAGPPRDAVAERFIKIHAKYRGAKVGGEFATHGHGVRITTGSLAGTEYSSPSQAAIAVVKSLNPDRTNKNTNGRIFWIVDATGQPLRSLIGKR